MSTISETKKWIKINDLMNLDRLLEEISVIPCQDQDPEYQIKGIENWWAVATTEGIVSYHCEESEALRYRLNIINRILND